MAIPMRSLDDALANDNAQGSLTRFFSIPASGGNITAATTGSGYTSVRRHARTFTTPTYSGNAYMTYFRATVNGGVANANIFAAIEFTFGTLTVSGNSYSDSGVTMPTRTIAGGSAQQLATIMPMLWVSTALTATTPTVTITYKNQAGAGSKTATLVLPTSPLVNTAFFVQPHLASGDTGIQDVTNISISTGSAGVLKMVGLLPVGVGSNSGSTVGMFEMDMLSSAFEMYPIVSGDVISFWQTGTTNNVGMMAAMQMQAEV